MRRALPANERGGSSRCAAAASRCWRHEKDEQCTMYSLACSRAAATLLCEGALSLCRAQSVRSDAWRNQGVCGMNNDGKGFQDLCAELFALCRYYSWIQSATPAGYAATRNQALRDPALRLPVHRVVKRREVSVLATSQG
jgi:hypothetical protein